MTLDDICRGLASLDHLEWYFESSYHPGRKMIRGRSENDIVTCPLLYYRTNLIPEGPEASALFSSELGQSIMDAADDNPNADPEVRQKLLVATGLSRPVADEEYVTPLKESKIWSCIAVAVFAIIEVFLFNWLY